MCPLLPQPLQLVKQFAPMGKINMGEGGKKNVIIFTQFSVFVHT